jgi:branched-chain amino acid transport system substrate-binding protein
MEREMPVKFSRRQVAVLGGAAILASRTAARADAPPTKIRVGYAVSFSGPYAQGAESTTWSQYRLWAKDVNATGGIYLKKYDKKLPVELVEYDDRSQLDEATRLVERLILEDKVDFVLPPWGTATNLAVAPLFNRYEYPAILFTISSMAAYEVAPKWPWTFFGLVQPDDATSPLAETVAKLKQGGKIAGSIAIMSVADQLGVEMSTQMVKEAQKHRLNIVYNKSYPLGVADLSGQIREMQQLKPDAFFAFSYPPDTFMIADQATTFGFSPAIYYSGVGTIFPAFYAKLGKKAEGVLCYGANDPDYPGFRDYAARHLAVYQRPTEGGAAGVYGTMQVLQSALETVGEIDRAKVRDVIAAGTFKTVYGEFKFVNQLIVKPWAVGQWQNGEIVPILPEDKPGARSLIFPKPTW